MNLRCLDDMIKTRCDTALTFSNLVTTGIRVETSQSNIFKSPEESPKGKKKEKEVHNIGGENSFNQSLYRVPGQYNKSTQQTISINIANHFSNHSNLPKLIKLHGNSPTTTSHSGTSTSLTISFIQALHSRRYASSKTCPSIHTTISTMV